MILMNAANTSHLNEIPEHCDAGGIDMFEITALKNKAKQN